ncbi:hypothetical protein AB0N24_23465 [Arthrobacter sp. NPDC093128]
MSGVHQLLKRFVYLAQATGSAPYLGGITKPGATGVNHLALSNQPQEDS